MKSFKEYYSILDEEYLEEDFVTAEMLSSTPPPVLVMKRKLIRSVGNGKSIALYHIDNINKYVIVPFENKSKSKK